MNKDNASFLLLLAITGGLGCFAVLCIISFFVAGPEALIESYERTREVFFNDNHPASAIPDRSSSASSNATKNAMNTSNPSSDKKKPVTVLKDVDFGPYMAELQDTIRKNWNPPSQKENKKVTVIFTVGKDGRLLSLRIIKSSNEPSVDSAAITAIHLSAPFKPLPENFSGNQVDVEFVFDYNIIKSKK